MNRASDKHRGSLVIGIQLGSLSRVLLCFRESPLAVRTRGLVQLVLGSDPVNDSTPGATNNKDRQKSNRDKNNRDPGLREFHLCVTPI
jgi:hypothetical protein